MTKPPYKQTSIGLIPTDWEVKKLGELVDIISGNSPSDFSLSEIGKYPYLKVEDLNNNYKYQYSSREFTNDEYKNLVLINSLIFPKRGAAILNNKIRISKTDCYLDSNLMALKISESKSLDLEYLYYKILDVQLFKIADTSSIPQLNNKHILPFVLAVPPLPEQQKIAEILSTWDKAIQETGLLLKKIEVRNKALAFSLLTGKKRVKGFEGKWEIKNFGKIISRVTKKNEELDDTVVTISAKRGFILQEDFFNKRVASDTLSGYYLLEKGQFAYNKSYSNGYPMGVFKRLNDFDKAVVTTLYICFELKENICSDFMVHYFDNGLMNTNLIKIAKEGGRAHGLLNIGIEDFMNLKITMPSLEEQTAIAEILNTAQQELKQYQEKLKSLQQQKKGLMQQLLTGKIRTV
ncbi:restriction endonuclease subunit S [Elizabethkingia anophelis]|uniref:restriction endonuclease subunit S n=1 Tax=Elizabethkingia anophelis TaxID=1117645 RepID=UPI0021A6CCF0|nr:restriction endonuclease subunit S [Elizabethkingia anophelis]